MTPAMSVPTISISTQELARFGLLFSESIHYQLQPAELICQSLQRGEGVLNDTGALVIRTGEFTGRSPKDKFIVKDKSTPSLINWNDFNIPLEEKYFPVILKKFSDYLNALPELWVRDCYACADPAYRLNIRVVTETPAMSLFAYNMFLRPDEEELESTRPDWHVIALPGLKLDPAVCGTRQANAAVISFAHKMILIAGTGYTGEIKKGIFTLLNAILPGEKNVLSMHCSANTGEAGDTAIFFGLSGTGKTTLSTDPRRKLIGDDEHGWSPTGIFNFEGGCYAKCIHLKEQQEPEIFGAIREGALVENVQFFPGSDEINFDNGSITENTRVSYPLDYIFNTARPSVGNIPSNIFFLTCDAYGVLPPLAKLTPEQAMYHFISGYTAKVAGTETGITEPKSTFSACFGAPFLPLHPGVYAEMLGRKMKENKVNVWLINTGWTGGPYLKGSRIKLSYTRCMINAVLDGALEQVSYTSHPIFGVAMPETCPGVPAALLNPVQTWEDAGCYYHEAAVLADKFIKNFRQYASGVAIGVAAAGPVSGNTY
jgi:phosphoenolpyruvate carboxykinase (ATP)